MEVHHPHHPTHKKKWSEYIIEFYFWERLLVFPPFFKQTKTHDCVQCVFPGFGDNLHRVNSESNRLSTDLTPSGTVLTPS